MNGFVHISHGYGLFAGLHSKPSIWSECSASQKKKKKKKKASFKKFLIHLKYNSMCFARYVWRDIINKVDLYGASLIS